MIISIAVGGLIGHLLDLDGRINRLGEWVQNKFRKKGGNSPIAEAFVTATLLYCVGAMAIVGSIQDGIAGDWSILATKSVLDLIIVMVMTGSMGRGCVFSAIPVAILQGTITALAGLLAPVMTDAALGNISMIGSVLIFCVGINLVWGKTIRVANMLPALVFAGVAVYLPVFHI